MHYLEDLSELLILSLKLLILLYHGLFFIIHLGVDILEVLNKI